MTTFYKRKKTSPADLDDYWVVIPDQAIARNFYFNGLAPVIITYTLGSDSIALMLKTAIDNSDISYEAENIYKEIWKGMEIKKAA
jgi:hypothetical protein